MYTVIRASELPPTPRGTVRFEGQAHGSGVSLFIINYVPGDAVNLHKHPYSETWVVRAGRARFVAGDNEVEAGPGDIFVVGPDTPHKFTNIGTEQLEMVCVHDSPEIIQVDLEPP